MYWQTTHMSYKATIINHQIIITHINNMALKGKVNVKVKNKFTVKEKLVIAYNKICREHNSSKPSNYVDLPIYNISGPEIKKWSQSTWKIKIEAAKSKLKKLPKNEDK